MIDYLIQEMDKGLAQSYFNSGKVFLGIKYFEKYIDELKKLAEQFPDENEIQTLITEAIEIYNSRLLESAQAAYNDKQWSKSLVCSQKLLLNKFPDNSVYKYASLSYKFLKQMDIRLKLAKKYFEVEERDPDRYQFIGEAYFETQNEENVLKSKEYYEKHLELNPNDAHCLNMLGHIHATCSKCFDVEQQLSYFKKAYAITPSDPVVLKNLILTYSKLNDFERAKNLYNELLKQKMSNDDYFDYAAFCIKMGDFDKGFKYYSHRFLKEHDPTFYPEINKKRWNGKTNISDSTLLVHLEQGFGDVILFVRFVHLIKKYAKNVILVAQESLCTIFQQSNLNIPIFPVEKTDLDKIKFDYHVPLLDLPGILNIKPDNVPFSEGYLNVSRELVENFKTKFINTDKFKIGISYEGAVTGKSQWRDIDLNKFIPLAKMENVQVYSLNIEKEDSLFEELGEDVNIINLGKNFTNFTDTAAAMKNMDLIISTDNAILNLAGAMGLSTFGLFNMQYEYRWFGINDGKTCWYSSIKPFLAKEQNAWDELLQNVYDEVGKLV